MSIIKILFADNDKDDFILFRDALNETKIPAEISNVNDGEHLMEVLKSSSTLPDILFLDLNMPRKNGLECLIEIKLLKNCKQLPIIIFSTSYDQKMVDQLYKNGARYYVRKPAKFLDLKVAIQNVINLTINEKLNQPTRENCVIKSEPKSIL